MVYHKTRNPPGIPLYFLQLLSHYNRFRRDIFHMLLDAGGAEVFDNERSNKSDMKSHLMRAVHYPPYLDCD